jgi:hypothetical protein
MGREATVRASLDGASGEVRDASRWERAILHPPSLLDKLGIRPGTSVACLGVDDEGFLADLAGRPDVEAVRDPAEADVVVLGAETVERLEELAALRRVVRPDAAVWVVRPKGPRGVPERAVMDAGARAGFVDVKVARFSATHTAEKFVIRVADRG